MLIWVSRSSYLVWGLFIASFSVSFFTFFRLLFHFFFFPDLLWRFSTRSFTFPFPNTITIPISVPITTSVSISALTRTTSRLGTRSWPRPAVSMPVRLWSAASFGTWWNWSSAWNRTWRWVTPSYASFAFFPPLTAFITFTRFSVLK